MQKLKSLRNIIKKKNAMKSSEIKALFKQFEQAASVYNGIECWSARELQTLLGYSKWENFSKVIDKAKEACNNAGINPHDHFPDIRNLIKRGKGSMYETIDILLTRYACYLIAQNGDTRKEQIAFAQTYFAMQTHIAEIVEKRMLDVERVNARVKLQETEKQLSGILYERGVNEKDFGVIRSKGDQALFHLSTLSLKNKLGTPKNRPIADFLPTVNIKAKDLAAEMTCVNVQTKDLTGTSPIEDEHIANNRAVRHTLLERGIVPENCLQQKILRK